MEDKNLKKIKFIFAIFITTIILFSSNAYSAGIENFKQTNSYKNGQFTDVSTGAWYADSIKQCYEIGLMTGNSNNSFNPTGTITIAEAVTVASRINKIYTDGDDDIGIAHKSYWYKPYVEYAKKHGIIEEGDFPDYNKRATRSQFAYILANALPKNEITAINNITYIHEIQEVLIHMMLELGA